MKDIIYSLPQGETLEEDNVSIIVGISIVGQKNHNKDEGWGKTAKLIQDTASLPNVKQIILIADGIQRFNLSIKNQAFADHPEYFKSEAKVLGEKWFNENMPLLEQKANITYVYYFDILESSPFFKQTYELIDQMLDNDTDFRMAFDHSCRDYVARMKNRLTPEEVLGFDQAKAEKISLEAIKEECAVIFALTLEQKAKYFAYPQGELEAFRVCKEIFINKYGVSLNWLRMKPKRQKKNEKKQKKYNTPSKNIDNTNLTTKNKIITTNEFNPAISKLIQDIQNIIPPEEMTERFEYYQGILAGFIGMMYTYQQIYHTKPTTMQTQQMQKALKENLPAIHANISLFFHNKNTSAISTNNDTQLIKPEYPLNDNPSSTRFSV